MEGKIQYYREADMETPEAVNLGLISCFEEATKSFLRTLRKVVY